MAKIMLIVLSVFMSDCSNLKESGINRLRDFNSGWSFTKDNPPDAQQPDFDNSAWRKIDLPHDWSIEDLPGQTPDEVIGPFTKKSEGPSNGQSTGHVAGGIGWYRKSFILDKTDEGKQISLYFEGAYMETDVWLNGIYLGNHKHGYTSFSFDITKFCKPAGEKNILAVRVMNRGQNSRWYSGSGIYRNVKLIVTNPIHVAQWGVTITTPVVSVRKARVQVVTEVLNKENQNSNSSLQTKILDANNQVICEAETKVVVPANSGIKNIENLEILQPNLWSPDSPYLYRLETTVVSKGKIEDRTISVFGIRILHFSAKEGFMLNDEKLELKGGCVHHDNGILGAVAIDRAEERKVELLKLNGFNAVRSSHNPPSEKFLEACDRLGLLVIDEAFDMWQKPKNPDDYHQFFDSCWEQDFSSMILRDRNHPSVILWSLGNEIKERADSSGTEITRKLKAKARELDPSRFITEAVCEFWDHPGRKWQQTEPAFELLDVCGYNYQWREYESDHQQFPERIIMGTESVTVQAFENWQLVEKLPYVIGDFVWTAMDYLGESGIGHAVPENVKDGQLMPWPWFNAYCGDIDLIGNKKPQSYYRDVVWKRSKIEMAVHAPMPEGVKERVSFWGWPDEQKNWNWHGHEGKILDVNVYSRAPLVRLMLNDKIIGEQEVSEKTNLTAKFKVPFEPGMLKAVAIENDNETASVTLESSGAPKRIHLTADRSIIKADRNDLSYVTVEILDDMDQLVPDAEIQVEFTVEGEGELAATGSANPSYMTSFKQPRTMTFKGRCLAILRPVGPAGKVSLRVNAQNLEPDSIIVRTTGNSN